MRKIGAALCTALVSVLLVICTLTVTFSLLLTPLPTHVFATWFADETYSGYTHAEMVDVADGILAYSLGDDSVEFPQGTSYQSRMDESSLAHLRECRVLFNGVISAAVASGIIVLIVLIVCAATHRKRLIGRAMTAATVITAAIVFGCVVWAIIDFGGFFDWMHHFFFTGGSWYFNADSLMICAVPTPFWIAMGVLWALLIVALCLAWWFIGRHLRRKYY